MKRTLTFGLSAAALTLTISLMAQTSVPEINFDTNADLLKTPPNTFLGEVAGVATNSKATFSCTRARGIRMRRWEIPEPSITPDRDSSSSARTDFRKGVRPGSLRVQCGAGPAG